MILSFHFFVLDLFWTLHACLIFEYEWTMAISSSSITSGIKSMTKNNDQDPFISSTAVSFDESSFTSMKSTDSISTDSKRSMINKDHRKTA